MSVTDELLANNALYAASFSGPLPLPPAKQVAVVACMDARINVYGVLGLREGDAHVIRNAGGVVTEDEIGFKQSIQDEVGIKPPWSAEAFTDLPTDVPPPANPVDAAADWPAVETALGVHLPADYREFVERYGSGEFCDLVHVLTAGELVPYAEDALDVERELAAEDPDDHPYPLHPEPGGLLPWGTTSNGHLLCWRTDDWTVVVYAPRDLEFDAYETTVTGFLHGWLSGELSPFPATFTETAQWFDQPRELTHVSVRLAPATVQGRTQHERWTEILGTQKY